MNINGAFPNLEELELVVLKRGDHTSAEDGMCVMEAVAWVAGEPWTDQPACACPVIAAFLRSWNDSIPDDARRTELLRPLVLRLVGSKSTPEIELQRSYLAFDWLARVQASAWLDLTPSLKPHADALRALVPLTDKNSVASAAATVDAAWAAARDAAMDAAGDAAWAAAWAAARAAAGDADGAADGDAAWAAALARLAPTVATLQASALDLVNRMLDLK